MSNHIKQLIEDWRKDTNHTFCKIVKTDCEDLMLVRNKYGFNIFYPCCISKGKCNQQTREVLMCKTTK